jgi:hypothetical protein
MSDENEKDQVYQVDTVPPPDGEADAYNAPTRVGQMAATTIVEMLMVAGVEEAEAKEIAAQGGASALPTPAAPPASVPQEAPPPSSPPASSPVDSARPVSSGSKPVLPPASLPPSSLPPGMMRTPSGSIVPRLHEPAEDDDEPDESLDNEVAPASFQPLPLAPAARPVFSPLQLILMAAIALSAGAAIYFLFR